MDSFHYPRTRTWRIPPNRKPPPLSSIGPHHPLRVLNCHRKNLRRSLPNQILESQIPRSHPNPSTPLRRNRKCPKHQSSAGSCAWDTDFSCLVLSPRLLHIVIVPDMPVLLSLSFSRLHRCCSFDSRCQRVKFYGKPCSPFSLLQYIPLTHPYGAPGSVQFFVRGNTSSE